MMPKFICRCQNIIDRNAIPNANEWLIINDEVFDQSFQGAVDSDDLYSKMLRALKCPKCGRLWVFWEHGKPAIAYCYEGEEGQLEADGGQ